jgi:cytoskeletal protein CcmA (bactofilin family)
MFKKDQLETPPDKVNTVIGKDTYFKGSLKAKGLIRIDGGMEGDVETQGDVVIGESGRVAIELKARSVAVAGRFEGTMDVGGKLEIRSSGVVIGTVKTNGLLVDDGAVFSGNVEMKRNEQLSKNGIVDKFKAVDIKESKE